MAACGGRTTGSDSANANGAAGATSQSGGDVSLVTKSDKLDLLLAIDNSSSMADKQAFFADAVPDLFQRIAAAGVTDIHVAVVSSSLGAFGDPSVCADSAPQNDHGHLITRTPSGTAPDAPSGFLSWTPSTDMTQFTSELRQIVIGDGQSGCGLEAQLESWYHFLVQPDPWASVTIDGYNVAHYTGVDETILTERAAFLRPDSIVAVIMLTDEDDSFSDALSTGGQGWAFSVSNFPGSVQPRNNGTGTTAPMATTACAANPADPACTSCGFAQDCDPSTAPCQAIKNDASCLSNKGYYAADEDSLNARFFHMKRRYGIDPQYPISRYTDGLSRAAVPRSSEEHDVIGLYQAGTGSCTNPLFAASLPATADAELCNLPRGPRDPSMVFFAIVGGVPNQLLHFDPANPGASSLSDDDWTKILGKDPLAFDYTGIDPHMWQAIAPNDGARASLPGPSATPGDNGTDPISGREWDTKKNDLQYACTFPLPAGSEKTCASTGDYTCGDCDGTQNPPLCGKNPLEQIRAKAYPTVRELEVARALGDQAVVGSICPRTVNLAGQELEPQADASGAPNPAYGYRPTAAAIVERIRRAVAVH
jgi:hypothetical protein